MVLLITVVFNLFLVLLWNVFCWCETFSFGVRHYFSFNVRNFLLPWDFFFLCKTVSFDVSFFLFLWVFFSRETFSFLVRHFLFLLNVYTENHSTESEHFSSAILEGSSRLCSLSLVLWAWHFYSLEKEEV